MSPLLCITVRFLDPVPRFHGRGDTGDPEWPPSPLRLFQALVCAAATRWRENQFKEYALPALQWLEVIPPSIVAPQVPAESFGYRMYVPNNSGDLMTAAWARGDTETSMAKFRVEKDVRPTHVRGGDPALHYLFPLADDTCPHFGVLSAAARSITHLGWGVDMVAGDARLISVDEAAALEGERWQPGLAAGTPLRVPISGTLDGLILKHGQFLGRLSGDGFKPVPPLSAFDIVNYRRATDPASRPFAAFRIVSLDPDEGTPAFDTPRRCRDVAAWVRNATGAVCQEWGDVASFVHGHDAVDSKKQLKGENADQRFMYLPLPSIERRGERGEHVGAIRRVLIAAPPGCQERIDWIQRRLAGFELVTEEGKRYLMIGLDGKDWVREQYTEPSDVWTTVTPVVLPGYDDPNHLRRKLRENRDAATQRRLLEQLDERVEGLLRKALHQAGFSEQLIESTMVEWQTFGFRRGVEPVQRYVRPENLQTFSAFHVRIRFPHVLRGPLAIGAGRYRGLGLFAASR